MRRLIISISLLTIVLIYSVSSLFFIKYKNEKLVTAIEEVQALYENNNYDQAIKKSYEVNEMWESYKKTLLITVNSEKVNEISISIARISPFISTENEKLTEEFQNIFYQLNQIYETECPTWYNIF